MYIHEQSCSVHVQCTCLVALHACIPVCSLHVYMSSHAYTCTVHVRFEGDSGASDLPDDSGELGILQVSLMALH